MIDKKPKDFIKNNHHIMKYFLDYYDAQKEYCPNYSPPNICSLDDCHVCSIKNCPSYLSIFYSWWGYEGYSILYDLGEAVRPNLTNDPEIEHINNQRDMPHYKIRDMLDYREWEKAFMENRKPFKCIFKSIIIAPIIRQQIKTYLEEDHPVEFVCRYQGKKYPEEIYRHWNRNGLWDYVY